MPSITCLALGCSCQVEGRRRFEFLEALVVSMDGHLRYFKRGYEVIRLPAEATVDAPYAARATDMRTRCRAAEIMK